MRFAKARLGVVVAAVELLLSLSVGRLPVPQWLQVAKRLSSFVRRISGDPEADRAAVAIESCGRRLGTSCLVQALAAHLFVDTRTAPLCLRIGVRRAEHGVLKAHAWVEREGRLLVGGHEPGAFDPLVSWTTAP